MSIPDFIFSSLIGNVPSTASATDALLRDCFPLLLRVSDYIFTPTQVGGQRIMEQSTELSHPSRATAGSSLYGVYEIPFYFVGKLVTKITTKYILPYHHRICRNIKAESPFIPL